MKFKHLRSGIIQLIVNTPDRWMYYRTLVTFKRDAEGKPINEQQFTIELSDPEDEFGAVDAINIDFDFDHRKYHKLAEQNKDQVVVYFIPKEMLM